MKQNEDINIQTGGYSGTGMLPFYAAFTTAIFILAPAIGLGISTALFYFLGIVTAVIAKIYFSESVEFDAKAHHEDWHSYRLRRRSGMPLIKDYMITEPSRFSQWYRSHTKALIKGKAALSAKKKSSSVRAIA